MARFSVVMPVHNEQDNLRYSLPALFSADPDEIIFVLDRCRDGSKVMIKTAAERLGYQGNVKLIEVSEDFPDWRFRVARLFRLGFKEARNDAILTMAADIIIDKRVREYVNVIESSETKLVSFDLKYYPVDPTLSRGLSPSFSPHGFQRSLPVLKESVDGDGGPGARKEDTKSAGHLPLERDKDEVLDEARLAGCHPLPRTQGREGPVPQGVTAYQITHKSLPSVFISSVLYLSPMMLKGYLSAREKARR